MKKQKITQKDILYLTGSLFLIVVIWIASNLYHAYVTSTIGPDLQIQITPIDATFDTAVIQKIKTRQAVEPNFDVIAPTPTEASAPAEIAPTAAPIISPITAPTEAPLPTQAITPTETPTVTP